MQVVVEKTRLNVLYPPPQHQNSQVPEHQKSSESRTPEKNLKKNRTVWQPWKLTYMERSDSNIAYKKKEKKNMVILQRWRIGHLFLKICYM